MRVRVQTVLGDWAENDAAEYDQETLDNVKGMFRDTLASRSGYVSLDKGATTTFVPCHSIARVVVEPAED